MARLSRRLWGGTSLKTAAKEAMYDPHHTLNTIQQRLEFEIKYRFKSNYGLKPCSQLIEIRVMIQIKMGIRSNNVLGLE